MLMFIISSLHIDIDIEFMDFLSLVFYIESLMFIPGLLSSFILFLQFAGVAFPLHLSLSLASLVT